jgi:hypothetical protein
MRWHCNVDAHVRCEDLLTNLAHRRRTEIVKRAAKLIGIC